MQADKMKMMGQVSLKISHRGTTIRATALVAEKLSHEMILKVHRAEDRAQNIPSAQDRGTGK